MTQNLTYNSRSYKVFMPESEIIKTVLVNKLVKTDAKTNMPLTKVEMPEEKGFFRGIEYTERNTLLEFDNNKREKITTIIFGEGGKEMFGSDEIKKTGKLTKIDQSIRDSVLSAWQKSTV